MTPWLQSFIDCMTDRCLAENNIALNNSVSKSVQIRDLETKSTLLYTRNVSHGTT